MEEKMELSFLNELFGLSTKESYGTDETPYDESEEDSIKNGTSAWY